MEADGVSELFGQNWLTFVRLAKLLGADDPEDVAAEAVLRAYRKRDKLADQRAAGAYVRAIVVNLVRDQARRRTRLRAALRQFPDRNDNHWSEQLSMESGALAAALLSLPLRQREAVVLRLWLDLAEEETANVMGVSRGSAKTHLHRAINSLRAQLERTAT